MEQGKIIAGTTRNYLIILALLGAYVRIQMYLLVTTSDEMRFAIFIL